MANSNSATEQAAFDGNARQAVQTLLGGSADHVDAASCGPWADRVEILQRAFEHGGRAQVYWEYNLMQDDLDLAALMAADNDLTAEAEEAPTTHGLSPGFGPTLAQPPVRMFLDQSADDEGNAQCVATTFAGQFLYCDAYGYLHWTGRYWSLGDAEAMLDRAVVYTLKRRRMTAVQASREDIIRSSMPSARRVRDCKYLIRSLVTVDVAEFDRDPESLNCANGVLNLRTGQLAPHDPQHRFTYCVPVPYEPSADRTQWDLFLGQVVGGGGDVLRYLQQAVGYSLSGYTQEECLFYIYGPTRSGKGTFSETLLAILPKPLGVEVDFVTFTASRDQDSQNFDLAPLKPARLVFASESNKYQGLNTGKIKSLTGGNEVRYAFKHRDHFSYRPQYKIWLVSNHPVNADVDDNAAWYRVKVIEFPNSMAAREDKGLKRRMREPENLRGVLAWAVEGAKLWLNSPHGLVTPQPVTAKTREHRDLLDYVRLWLDECTEKDEPGWATSEAVYQSYSEWCKANGVKPKEQRSFVATLKTRGFQVGVQKWVGPRNLRAIVGLRIL